MKQYLRDAERLLYEDKERIRILSQPDGRKPARLEKYQHGGWITVHQTHKEVQLYQHRGWMPVHLTPKEAQLLYALVSAHLANPDDSTISYGRILQDVWDFPEAYVAEALTDSKNDPASTLHIHISWLRKKIEENPSEPRYIRTVRGVGYSFGRPDR